MIAVPTDTEPPTDIAYRNGLPAFQFLLLRLLPVLTLGLGFTLLSTISLAQPLILTIKGVAPQDVSFTLNELQALPSDKVTTETIWTDTPHTYTTVSFKTLFEHLKSDPKGKTLTMVALNDYFIKVEIDTLIEHNAFIAYAMDGKEMRIRDKGPLWVLYPFSDKPAINIPPFQAHSIWQLKAIILNP